MSKCTNTFAGARVNKQGVMFIGKVRFNIYSAISRDQYCVMFLIKWERVLRVNC